MLNKSQAHNYITLEGLEELKKEYKELVEVKRPALMREIGDLRSMGDLSENEAYHTARRDQAFMEGRIKKLEEMIKNSIVRKSSGVKGKIHLGSKFIVEIEGEPQEFVLVGTNEANLLQGKISVSSPLGEALEGCAEGEEVKIMAPAGEIVYKVSKILE